MPDDTPDPTSANSGTGVVTRDYVGVRMTVEAAAARTPASGPNMFRVTLGIPIIPVNREIIADLMAQMRQDVFVGFGFMQGALDFNQTQDDAAPAPSVLPDDTPVPYVITGSGDIVFPHKYIKPRRGGAPGTCGACEMLEAHAIHWPESIALRKEHGDDKIREMVEERRNSNNGHSAPTDELSPEAAQLIEQIPPSDSRREVDQTKPLRPNRIWHPSRSPDMLPWSNPGPLRVSSPSHWSAPSVHLRHCSVNSGDRGLL